MEPYTQKIRPLLLASIAICYSFMSPAFAQQNNMTPVGTFNQSINNIETDTEESVTVSSRIESDYMVKPFYWRGFSLQPKIETKQIIDTNIYATSNNPQTDTITTIKPSFLLGKELGRHQASLELSTEAKKFWGNPNNDFLNTQARLAGTIEARRTFRIPFDVTYSRAHEARSQNFSDNTAKKPIRYNNFNTALGFIYKPNRLNLSFIGGYNRLNFQNGETVSGTAIIRQDDNRSTINLKAKAGYDILPNHEAFVTLEQNSATYDHPNFENNGFNGAFKDSKTRSFLLGWNLSYKGLLEGSIGIGESERNYKSPDITDIRSAIASIKADLNLTPKSMLGIDISRYTTENNATLQGIISTQGAVKYDHEILHNIFLDGFISYALLDVQGTDRKDNLYATGFGARYNITPKLQASASYEYNKRDSNAENLDYDRHQIIARLTTNF